MVASQRTDVLVVGAGPVGLFAALRLAREGLAVRVIDKFQRSALHSYALALHPATIRLMDRVGLADDLIRLGRRVESLAIYQSEEEVARLSFCALPEPGCFVLILPQPLLEAALEARLGQAGVQVSWNHQLLVAEESGERVQATVGMTERCTDGGPSDDPPRMQTIRIEASFVIGADGQDSLTRRLLGIDLQRIGPPTNYRVLEFERADEVPDEIRLILAPETSDVLWPLGPRSGRWGLQVRGGANGHEGIGNVDPLLRSRASWFAGVPFVVGWDTTLTFERRLARRFGSGRIWLVGDAAHSTIPIGVQSMNVGLSEADDLVRRIAAIYAGGVEPGPLLEAYADARQNEWRALLGLDAGALGASRLTQCLPASGSDLKALLSQLASG